MPATAFYTSKTLPPLGSIFTFTRNKKSRPWHSSRGQTLTSVCGDPVSIPENTSEIYGGQSGAEVGFSFTFCFSSLLIIQSLLRTYLSPPHDMTRAIALTKQHFIKPSVLLRGIIFYPAYASLGVKVVSSTHIKFVSFTFQNCDAYRCLVSFP